MMLSTAASEPPRSWAGIVALVAAYVIFRVGSYAWTKIRNSSPTPALPGANRVKVQAKVGVNTDRTNDTEPEEVDWWGRIRQVGGVRFRQARQIVQTGSHELPEGDDAEDIDVPLDDEDEPASRQPESAEGYVARCRDLAVPYAHIVRVLCKHYGLTVDQAKYRIRKVDEERRGSAAA